MDKQLWQKRGFALAARMGAAATRARSDGRLQLLASAARQFGAAFILSRGTVFGFYAPFAVAITAAAATVSSGCAAALGAAVGCLLLRDGMSALTTCGALVLVLVCARVFEGTYRQRRWFLPVCGAVSLAVTGFVLPETLDFSAMSRLLAAGLIAGGLGYCYGTALQPPRSKQAVSRPLSLLILLASLFAAFGDWTLPNGIAPTRIFGMALLLGTAYLCGSGTSAAGGVALGAAMDAARGGGGYFTCYYGLTCLIAGAFQHTNRFLFAVGALLAGGCAALLGAAQDCFFPSVFELVFAVVLFLLVPPLFWQMAQDYLRPARSNAAENARRIRAEAGKCATEAARAFYEMYLNLLNGAEYGSAAADEQLQQVFLHAAEQVCKRCASCGSCWQRRSVETMQAFSDATVPLLKRGRVEPTDFTNGFRARCVHFPELLHAMNSGLENLREREQFARQCAENRSLIARQYAGLTGVLGQVCRNMREGTVDLPERERQALRYAAAFGRIDKAGVWRDGKGRLRVEFSGSGIEKIMAESGGFSAGLGALLGCGLTEPERISDELGDRIALREQAPYRAVVGVSQKQKEGERVSGDSGRSFVTEDGMACMMLADGMGSGAEAARDSRMILSLMERFLRAGVPPEDAIRTIAPAFQLRCGGERGVTLDLLTIDLFTGKGVCLKCGAAPGYQRIGGTVSAFQGGGLPIGLNEDGVENGIPVKMGHGDLFVMMTDGVCDGTEDAWVRGVLSGRLGDNGPKEMALQLVQGAAERGASDDLTALVVRLERRPVKGA